jgi:hypothetical protein
MRAKGGGNPDLEMWFEAPRQMGAAVDITFNFDRIQKAPNTLLAHRAIRLTPDDQRAAMIDALYDAYFEFGEDVGDIDVIVGAAERAGVDAVEVEGDVHCCAHLSRHLEPHLQVGVTAALRAHVLAEVVALWGDVAIEKKGTVDDGDRFALPAFERARQMPLADAAPGTRDVLIDFDLHTLHLNFILTLFSPLTLIMAITHLFLI